MPILLVLEIKYQLPHVIVIRVARDMEVRGKGVCVAGVTGRLEGGGGIGVLGFFKDFFRGFGFVELSELFFVKYERWECFLSLEVSLFLGSLFPHLLQLNLPLLIINSSPCLDL